jgi:hypothetical protein
MGWTMPDHARAALQHLAEKFKAQPTGEVDLSWARRIVARHQAGETIASATLRMACEALRIPIPTKPTKETPWD